MIATWTMNGGLQMRGRHNGQPRVWTVTAWASIASGEKISVYIKPKGKVKLADLIDLANEALMQIEVEKNQPTTDAGFTAVAR